jgi:hypothetical protein
MQEGEIPASREEICLLLNLQLILRLFRSLQRHFGGCEVHLIVGINDEVRLHQEILQVLMQNLQSLVKGHLRLLSLQPEINRFREEGKSQQILPFDTLLSVDFEHL